MTTGIDVGYVRVSFKTQNLDRQIYKMMVEKGIEERFLFTDKATGANFDRPGYEAMKKILRKGDCLYIDSLDRLGRDYDGIIKEWKAITRELGADIVALDNEQLIDSRKFRDMGPLGALMEDQFLSMLAYVASIEREKNKQRQKEGIEAARRAGKQLGRPPSVSDWELFDRVAKRWVDGEITAAEACRLTGCKKTSWYKYTRNRGFVKEKV